MRKRTLLPVFVMRSVLSFRRRWPSNLRMETADAFHVARHLIKGYGGGATVRAKSMSGAGTVSVGGGRSHK